MTTTIRFESNEGRHSAEVYISQPGARVRVVVERSRLEDLGPAVRERLHHEAKAAGIDPGAVVRALSALGC